MQDSSEAAAVVKRRAEGLKRKEKLFLDINSFIKATSNYYKLTI